MRRIMENQNSKNTLAPSSKKTLAVCLPILPAPLVINAILLSNLFILNNLKLNILFNLTHENTDLGLR